MDIDRKYQFEHCECLGPEQKFNLVIPSGTWCVDESNAAVKIILGFRVKEVDKAAFEHLKSTGKAKRL